MVGSTPKPKLPFDKKPVGRPTVKSPSASAKITPKPPTPPKPPGKVQMPSKPRTPLPKTLGNKPKA